MGWNRFRQGRAIPVPSSAAITDFLAQRSIAVIGVSRSPREFANIVFRTLRERGYLVIPVNARASEVEGERCYRSVTELPAPVDGALLMVPPAAAAAVVRQCEEAGIRRIWFHKGAGPGAVSAEAVAAARAAGMTVVDGACPLMFLRPTGWFHRCHGAVLRWSGAIQP